MIISNNFILIFCSWQAHFIPCCSLKIITQYFFFPRIKWCRFLTKWFFPLNIRIIRSYTCPVMIRFIIYLLIIMCFKHTCYIYNSGNFLCHLTDKLFLADMTSELWQFITHNLNWCRYKQLTTWYFIFR